MERSCGDWNLNGNLISIGATFLGATFLREAQTEAAYRLWSIDDRHPAMLKVAFGDVLIAVERWSVPDYGLGTTLMLELPGLCIGKVRLLDGELDGEMALGVLGEAFLCEGKQGITSYGGGRSYLAAQHND